MKNRYISLEMVDRICEVLGCDISDIISHKSGEQIESDYSIYVDIDEDKLKGLLNDLGLTLFSGSQKIGKYNNYLSNLCKRGRMKRRDYVKVRDAFGGYEFKK